MRVVGVVDPGGPEALQVHEVPDPPAPGAGKVKVRVHAATVNPTDTYMRNGAYIPMLKDASPPYIPGMDAAGVVTEVGEGVTRVAVGDAVMAVVLPTRPEGGAYAGQIVVREGSVTQAPAGTSHAEAATLPMNGLTARLTLDKLALEPGQTIAVTGAAGAYGGYVVQLAKADGLHVIADASETDEQLVRDLGADVVVRRGDDVAERILEAAPGGVDAIADGSVQQSLLLPALRDGGGFASVRAYEGEPQRDITFHTIWISEYATAGEKLDELRDLAEKGAITLRVARTFAADDAHEAHRLLEAGGVRGRLVIEL